MSRTNASPLPKTEWSFNNMSGMEAANAFWYEYCKSSERAKEIVSSYRDSASDLRVENLHVGGDTTLPVPTLRNALAGDGEPEVETFPTDPATFAPMFSIYAALADCPHFPGTPWQAIPKAARPQDFENNHYHNPVPASIACVDLPKAKHMDVVTSGLTGGAQTGPSWRHWRSW